MLDSTIIKYKGNSKSFIFWCSIGSNKRTVVIAGIQELEVIKIFVLNLELYFDKKYLGTIDDYSVPKARKIDNISKLEIEL